MISEILPFAAKYFNYLSFIVISYVVLIELYKWSTRRTTLSETHVFAESDESTDPSESNVTSEHLYAHTCIFMRVRQSCQAFEKLDVRKM